MTSVDGGAYAPVRNFRILGILWLVYGILCLVGVLWLLSFTNTATVMFGALLVRVPDPFTMMSEFHIFYAVTIVYFAICGVLAVLAGLALLASQRLGRSLAIVASLLSVSSIPLGTTLGVYTLVQLIPIGYSDIAAAKLDTQSAGIRRQAMTT